MIVTQLLGGLGNQMFQYALGRALAEFHKVELRLDTARFGDYRRRKFGLHNLAIEAKELSKHEREEMRLDALEASGLRGRFARWFRPPRVAIVGERGFEFDARVLRAPPECYLRGYWQSPKYFASAEALVRKEFTVRRPLAGQNLNVAQQIAACNAVSLHVRRGDYAHDPATSGFHGTCDPNYYAVAESKLRQRIGDLTLFVFSDDLEWARDNLRLKSPMVIVAHNGPELDYEDLRLISLCKHHIIGNSTFSWWGAWLSLSPGKVVIAPSRWFRQAGPSTADLIPIDWIRI